LKRARLRDEGPVSFLSRLGGRGAGGEPRPEERFRREVAAVIRNLEHIFNSRKGVGCVVASFGLGDYEAVTLADGTQQPRLAAKRILRVLVPEIEAQVKKFEPRIADPAVEPLGRDSRMRAIFAVRGAVSGRQVQFRVALDTVYRDVEVQAEGEGLS
jgi:predicted component of type VI protein secretion system